MKNPNETTNIDSNNNQKKLNIEITQGDGSELEISQVFEHLNDAKPKIEKTKNKKKIIIPKEKSN